MFSVSYLGKCLQQELSFLTVVREEQKICKEIEESFMGMIERSIRK